MTQLILSDMLGRDFKNPSPRRRLIAIRRLAKSMGMELKAPPKGAPCPFLPQKEGKHTSEESHEE